MGIKDDLRAIRAKKDPRRNERQSKEGGTEGVLSYNADSDV